MNRLLVNNCRCLARSTLLRETRQYKNFPYITLSRSLSYYTNQPLSLHHDVTQKPLYTRLYCHPQSIRPISTSKYIFDKEPLRPSSKVEATVATIKKGIEEQEKLPKKEEKKKKSLKERFMDECRHYYHGFRLLFIEIRISASLLFKILKGYTLTRREHKLLVTTIGDLFRIVPFIVFIVVPFLEFALPIFIKLFPNMLPSTFESTDQKEAKLKQHLKVKLEMAKFFQETLDQMAPQASNRHSELAREFSSFFNRIRTSGDVATSEEIMKFSKLFEDEITLDSLQRPHLVALCKVLNVTTIGTSAMLRFNLKMKLRSLAADDKMIAKEGVDSLNFSELQQACRARGMRAYGVSEERLRKELRNWLDLSLNEKVPPSLLLLSRALMVPEHVPTTYKLKATISALPEQVATQTKAAIGEKEGKLDFKAKAEAIKLEELKIKEEQKELQEAEREKQILEAKKREKETLKDKAPIIDIEASPVMIDPAPVIIVDSPKVKSEEGLSGKDIVVIEDALEKLAEQKKSLLLEKESIQELKTELLDYSEDVKEMQEIVKTKQADIKLTKGARRLYRAVNNMISKLDAALVELETKEKALKTTLEQTKSEPQKAKEQLIQIDELMHSIKSLQKVPDEAKLKLIQDVLGRLDDDFDGQLKIDDVLKVQENGADLASVDDIRVAAAAYRYNLHPVFHEVYGDSKTPNYAVAVVKKGTLYNKIEDLRGKRSCHNSYGSFSGFNAPLYYLINKHIINHDQCLKNFADFFSGSCLPGVDKPENNPRGDDVSKLKKQCSGDNSPLKCLEEDRGDVAFVSSSDLTNYDASKYELLCLNRDAGGRDSLSNNATCNIVMAPSRTWMAAKDFLSDVSIAHTPLSLAQLLDTRTDLFNIYGEFLKNNNVIFNNAAKGLATTDKLDFEKFKQVHDVISSCGVA